MQAGNAEGKSYSSAFDGLRKIIAQEGARGLYKGIGPKLTQSVATVSAPLVLGLAIALRRTRVAGCPPFPCQGEDLHRDPQGESFLREVMSSRAMTAFNCRHSSRPQSRRPHERRRC